MQNLDIIEINDEQAYDAKLLASSMSTPQKRKRGMIDMLGISCAITYLKAKRFRIDTKRSVYKIPLLFEEFKISDIYFGNYRIDVITLYKEKNIKIPKIQIDMDIMPNFYFVVQIGSKIKEAKMVGFIEARNVLKCSHDSKYYYPTLDLLIDVQKFSTLTKRTIPTKTLLGKHVDCMGLFLKFIDNDLSSVYKRQMIYHLMNCDSCRSCFIDTIEFERMANNIRFYPDLIKRHEKKTQAPSVYVDSNKMNTPISFEEGIQKANIAPSIPPETEAFIDIQKELEDDKTPKTVQMFDIIDNKQTKRGVIDSIFNDIPKFELPQIKTIANAQTKRALMIIVGIIIVLGSFALISFKGTSDIIEENKEIAGLDEIDEEYNEEDYVNSNIAPSRPLPESNIDDFVIKRPKISNQPTYSPTIAKLSWEVPASLVKKEEYTKFLQLIGKNVKLNLQNDLLLVSDVPTNKTVKVDIDIAPNGNVNSIKMANSSGSQAIDSSVKKIVSETLTYMKPPSHGIGIKSALVTLSVELN